MNRTSKHFILSEHSLKTSKSSFFKFKPINHTTIKKPSLRSSKSNIEEMKKKIYKIIEDNLTLSRINTIQNKNALLFSNTSSEALETYDESIESLFKDKIDKLKEINIKYNSEIYELQQDIEEEDVNKKNNEDNNINVNSSMKLIYDNLLEDKNKEIKDLEIEYNKKMNKIQENYKNNFELEELDERSIIYRNEIIDNMKIQIEDVINPPINKKVAFNLKIK